MAQKLNNGKIPLDTRSEEVSSIVSYIKNGEFCQLIGLPGVGREHLFELLRSEKQIRFLHFGEEEKNYHFVLVDFAELRGKSLPEVFKLLFLELSDSLRERGYLDEYALVKKELDEALSGQDSAVLHQKLKYSIEYLSLERKRHITFLFDRFEEYIPKVSDEFFVGLSSLRRRSGEKFSVVFALTRPLEHSIEPEYFKDAYDLLAGNRVFMKLHDKPTIAYEEEKIEEATGKIPEEVKDQVVTQTGGHRKMVIVSLEEVLRSSLLLDQSGELRSEKLLDSPAKRDHLKNTLEKLLLDSLALRNISYQIWNSLRPQEQMLLKRQVTCQGENISENEDEEKRMQYLVDVGLLSNETMKQSINELYFTIPLFASFVSYRVEHKLDERLMYKPEEKQVFIGEQNITDTFTSFEKKAILYLLEHVNTVVSRDDLISKVWKESVSTEGVTDQALDQLVYRIRRKIEPDFGKPRYLLTVKGIGFKFSL